MACAAQPGLSSVRRRYRSRHPPRALRRARRELSPARDHSTGSTGPPMDRPQKQTGSPLPVPVPSQLPQVGGVTRSRAIAARRRDRKVPHSTPAASTTDAPPGGGHEAAQGGRDHEPARQLRAASLMRASPPRTRMGDSSRMEVCNEQESTRGDPGSPDARRSPREPRSGAGEEAEHRRHHGRRHRLVQSEHLPPRDHGI